MANVFFERSPLQQAIKHRAERLAPLRQSIFHFWRNLMMDDPLHNPIIFQLTQLLYEHLLCDRRNRTFEF